ncbi:MAG: hypothetical protein A2W28_12300 [Gammaproteobacteria bacterium RBG_16_51_14]|nr:MAG: hypothetical protein A2W28_12300 [Gammaproteobacteria bacterium RBG_16_51_14]
MSRNFIVQVLQGKDITIYGDGDQTRSFCYVDDLVDGMLRMMASSADVTGPINMGNPQELAILEPAEKIVSLVGGKSKPCFKPLPTDDPRQRQLDITMARLALGWEPKVPLETGPWRTVEHFRREFSGN